MTRPLWIALGAASLVTGLVGAVLPLLPTTPFLLLAAYSFARGSPSLHAWLIEHPRLGPVIEDWQRYGAIALRAKGVAADHDSGVTLGHLRSIRCSYLAVGDSGRRAGGLRHFHRHAARPPERSAFALIQKTTARAQSIFSQRGETVPVN
jgi:hypothetical protein